MALNPPWQARQAVRVIKSAWSSLRGYWYGRSLKTGEPPPVGLVIGKGTNPLEEYFDSVEEGPGIWKWRHYFDIYHRHFGKFVGHPVRIVEIGVYSGGSLGMWRSYFGEQATIYGVDIEPSCKVYEEDGVHIFIGDQADPSFWADFKRQVPEVDIVLDDGGHPLAPADHHARAVAAPHPSRRGVSL